MLLIKYNIFLEIGHGIHVFTRISIPIFLFRDDNSPSEKFKTSLSPSSWLSSFPSFFHDFEHALSLFRCAHLGRISRNRAMPDDGADWLLLPPLLPDPRAKWKLDVWARDAHEFIFSASR